MFAFASGIGPGNLQVCARWRRCAGNGKRKVAAGLAARHAELDHVSSNILRLTAIVVGTLHTLREQARKPACLIGIIRFYNIAK
ncbi:MAG: hypothetical protein K8F53_07975 [Rhodocyclaceae bacterium]|jgi:hypothetical protein|nr:hypothetical protein [Rhodocyclaceae bacterium]